MSTNTPPDPMASAPTVGPYGGDTGDAVEVVARAKRAATAALTREWKSDDYSCESLAHIATDAVLAALSSAGFLATEQEWGVRYTPELPGQRGFVLSRDAEVAERAASAFKDGVPSSRRVTAWRDQA